MSRAFVLEDLAEVNAWYRARSLGELAPASLPAIGEIISGVAVGFLYRTDSEFGLLEGYVTNPAASRRARHQAVHEVTRALIARGKAAGVRRIVALCKVRSIAKAAAQHGLGVVGHYTLAAGEV